MSRYIPEYMRKFVAHRANHCCEYCQLHENDAYYSHQIEHIVSLKHGGLTILLNLAFACSHCNNHKGSDLATMLLPNRTLIGLFNPREHVWAEHFEIRRHSRFGVQRRCSGFLAWRHRRRNRVSFMPSRSRKRGCVNNLSIRHIYNVPYV